MGKTWPPPSPPLKPSSVASLPPAPPTFVVLPGLVGSWDGAPWALRLGLCHLGRRKYGEFNGNSSNKTMTLEKNETSQKNGLTNCRKMSYSFCSQHWLIELKFPFSGDTDLIINTSTSWIILGGPNTAQLTSETETEIGKWKLFLGYYHVISFWKLDITWYNHMFWTTRNNCFFCKWISWYCVTVYIILFEPVSSSLMAAEVAPQGSPRVSSPVLRHLQEWSPPCEYLGSPKAFNGGTRNSSSDVMVT